jgi:hypothetical protein
MDEKLSRVIRKPRRFPRAIVILILVALFAPHSLRFSTWFSHIWAGVKVVDFSLLAVCWSLVRQERYLFSDHYSSLSLQFASEDALISAVAILVLYSIVIYYQLKFIRGVATRNMTLLVIVIALAVQVLLIGSWVTFDGFAAYGAYPFPIFFILNLVSVFWQREPK